MLYRATYYSGRDAYGDATFETRILPTLRAVKLWAEIKLRGVHVTTTRDCYHRDVARAPSVTWHTTKRKPYTYPGETGVVMRPTAHGEILPTITIVPSVGELGYSP